MGNARRGRLVVVTGPDAAGLNAAVEAVRNAADADREAVVIVSGTAAIPSTTDTAANAASLPPDVTVVTTDGPLTTGVIRRHAANATRVLVAPSLDHDLAALRTDLDLPVERLPSGDGTTEPGPSLDPGIVDVDGLPMVHGRGPARFVATYAVAYGFYLLLGDPTAPFDLVTGAVVAGVVAVALGPTVFADSPTLGRTLPRLARGVVFLPYLLWEVVKANVALAATLLRPSLPVEPSLVRVRPDTDEAVEVAVLATALTLTPGTLAVEADEDGLVVHALTDGARGALLEGVLARAVRFVFHGRDG